MPLFCRVLGIRCQFSNTHLAPSPSDPRKWQIQCCPFVFALSPEDPVVVPVFSLGICVLFPGSQAGVGFSCQSLQVSDMTKYDSIISFILFPSLPPPLPSHLICLDVPRSQKDLSCKRAWNQAALQSPKTMPSPHIFSTSQVLISHTHQYKKSLRTEPLQGKRFELQQFVGHSTWVQPLALPNLSTKGPQFP